MILQQIHPQTVQYKVHSIYPNVENPSKSPVKIVVQYEPGVTPAANKIPAPVKIVVQYEPGVTSAANQIPAPVKIKSSRNQANAKK